MGNTLSRVSDSSSLEMCSRSVLCLDSSSRHFSSNSRYIHTRTHTHTIYYYTVKVKQKLYNKM